MRKINLFINIIMVVVIGVGLASPSMPTAQGRMMARRAAIVDVFRQTGGAPFDVISQEYANGKYIIHAEVR